MKENAVEILEAALNIVQEENSFLEVGNVTAAMALLARKESILERVAGLKSVCERNAEDERECCSEDLPEAARRLDAALTENRTLLQRAMTAQNHIVGLIMNALPRPASQGNYSRKGDYAPARCSPGRAYHNKA